MKISHIYFILILLVCFNEIDGQVLGPELIKHKFEIGYVYKWFNRKLEPHYWVECDWQYRSLFMKYGVDQWLTLSAEGLILNCKSERFPERDYRGYRFGAGIISRIVEAKGFRIALSFHYNEILYFDRSDSACHKSARGFVAAIQVERTFSFYDQNITLWAAPTYACDEITQYLYGHYEPYVDKSLNNWGFAIGTNILLLSHIEPFVHIVYADFIQPRLGIGFQF